MWGGQGGSRGAGGQLGKTEGGRKIRKRSSGEQDERGEWRERGKRRLEIERECSVHRTHAPHDRRQGRHDRHNVLRAESS